MDRVEADLTPGQEWQQSLNATVNRLSTQYVNLLRAASSTSALEKGQQDPRGMYIYIMRLNIGVCTMSALCKVQYLIALPHVVVFLFRFDNRILGF